MVNKRFKALVKSSSVTLISLSFISACTMDKGLNGVVAPYSTPSISGSLATQPSSSPTQPSSSPTQPSSSQSQPIWGCRAENGKRMYVVDQLNDNSDNFDMAIYSRNGSSGKELGNYIGTVQVNVTQKKSGGVELIGRAQTSNSTVEVNAFGRTVGFSVRDSVNGQASGRCNVQWQMADNETRRLVRQCLAFTARKFGNLSEVDRFACIVNPRSYLEELKRR